MNATLTLVRDYYTVTIVLDSPTTGADRWGRFIKIGPGAWREDWPSGHNPIWREQND